MASVKSSIVAIQPKIYKELLKISLGRDTPMEHLKDFLTHVYGDMELREEERIKLVSTTIASIIQGITTVAMQMSIELAQKDAKFPLEASLIQAQIAELEASGELKKAQKDKLDKEKESENFKIELYKAQAEEIRQKIKESKTKEALMVVQGNYYKSQAEIEKAKISSEVAGMAFTNDTVVGKEVWADVKKYINNISDANLTMQVRG